MSTLWTIGQLIKYNLQVAFSLFRNSIMLFQLVKLKFRDALCKFILRLRKNVTTFVFIKGKGVP